MAFIFGFVLLIELLFWLKGCGFESHSGLFLLLSFYCL
jgi:hypothetical protein